MENHQSALSHLHLASYDDIISIAKERLSGVKRYWYVAALMLFLGSIIFSLFGRELTINSNSSFNPNSWKAATLQWCLGLIFMLGVQRILLKHLQKEEHSWDDFFRLDAVFLNYTILQLLLLLTYFLQPTPSVMPVEIPWLTMLLTITITAIVGALIRYLGYGLIYYESPIPQVIRTTTGNFWRQFEKLITLFVHVLALSVGMILLIFIGRFFGAMMMAVVGLVLVPFAIRWMAFFEIVFALIFLQGQYQAEDAATEGLVIWDD